MFTGFSLTQTKLLLVYSLLFLLPTQLGLHFWPESALVFGIRVDYLSPTVYLTDLVVISLLVIWLLERKTVTLSKINRRILSLSLITILYFLATSLLASNPGTAFYKLLKFIELGLLVCFIALHSTLLTSQKAKNILALSVVFFSLIALGQVIKQDTLGGVFWFLGERTFTLNTPGIAKETVGGIEILRPYSTFSHPNSLAGFLLVILILLQPWKNLLSYLAVLLGGIAIVLSFSHAVWFGLGFILLVQVLKIQRLSLLTISLITIAVLSLLPLFGVAVLPYQEVVVRRELLLVSWEMFKNNLLFGVGLNNNVVQLPQYWILGSVWWLQPVHNIYFLVLTELGLVGGILITWLICKLRPWKAGDKLLYCLIVILLTGSLDHYWLTLQQNQLLLAIVLGLSSRGVSAKLKQDV